MVIFTHQCRYGMPITSLGHKPSSTFATIFWSRSYPFHYELHGSQYLYVDININCTPCVTSSLCTTTLLTSTIFCFRKNEISIIKMKSMYHETHLFNLNNRLLMLFNKTKLYTFRNVYFYLQVTLTYWRTLYQIKI